MMNRYRSGIGLWAAAALALAPKAIEELESAGRRVSRKVYHAPGWGHYGKGNAKRLQRRALNISARQQRLGGKKRRDGGVNP